ncbi:Transcriptional regulatory protein moc3 [Cladobotryum mycophilum]|uniref:Transcriptional regulatory protein moc3 n=1 Tax=Cladobotryum mycophilum TaxID=491253 RepID=A0ABR0SX48_9HYPO
MSTTSDESYLTSNQTKLETVRSLAPRRRYKKTKAACRTCRTRKIRCDETLPFCNNCTRTGRICDGVTDSPARPKEVRFKAPLTLSNFRPSQLGSSFGQDEVFYLGLFRSRFIYTIVGWDASPKQAWMRLILQAVHEEESLSHAIIAFSALNDDTRNESNADNRFALHHYGKCIASLRCIFDQDHSRYINVALLCSLFCICFELRMREPSLAQTHLEHSLNVLASSFASVEDEVATAFARLDLQASIYLGARPPALDLGRIRSIKPSYESLYQEADEVLVELDAKLYTFLRTTANKYRYIEPGSIPLEILAKQHDLEAQFQDYHDKYLALDASFMNAAPRMTQEQESLLTIKYLTAVHTLAASLYAEETIYDRFSSEFITIVDLSADILNKKTCRDGTFLLDMGVIHPLYMVATKCRCPMTRRRAISLLHNFPGVEGVWDGAPNARVAEVIMRREEEGLGYDADNWDITRTWVIPEWRRIHAADIYPDAKGRRATVYLRWLPNGLDGGWEDAREDFTW